MKSGPLGEGPVSFARVRFGYLPSTFLMPLAATTAPPPMASRPGPGRMSIGTPTSMIAPPTAVCTAPPMRLGFFFPEAGPPSMMVASLMVGGGSKPRVACDYTGSTEPCAWGGVLATGSSPFGNVLFAGSPKTSAAFRIRADARDAAAKSPISAD